MAVLLLAAACQEQEVHICPMDPLRSNQTWTYEEGISWWDSLARFSAEISMQEFGETDAGYPLHLVILSKRANNLEELTKSSAPCLLINNAIHPGEPDGVDASMSFFRDLALDNERRDSFGELDIVCIPFYNIGGALNLNSHSRANQEGPAQYGFRGNAQNLDLNRDFVKMDSRNARSFNSLVAQLDPEIYLETHVSNGADYPYTMTYLSTQPDKLGFGQGRYLREKLTPSLEESMLLSGFEMVPYVNVHGTALDSSYDCFYDSPRYSTGLMAMKQCLAYITETHMLKAFDQRVLATKAFIYSLAGYGASHGKEILELRTRARKELSETDSIAVDWQLDRTRSDSIQFNGFPYTYIPSKVHGADRLQYLSAYPLVRDMRFYGYMTPKLMRAKPTAYVVKGGYTDVVACLDRMMLPYRVLERDSTISVTRYRIENFETNTSPFEKHYFHYNTTFSADTLEWKFFKGDLILSLGSPSDRLLMELLEPDGPDSYFNWNFFDAILQQKEWYSAYVFEDKAAELLANDPDLRDQFEAMKNQQAGFASNPQWQLYWVYQHSQHYEKEHMTLPVYRIE